MTENISKQINEAQITKKLCISDETITDEIWNEINKIDQLESLSLLNNRIDDIHNLFRELNHLKKIHLRGSNEFDALQFLYNSMDCIEILDQLKHEHRSLVSSKHELLDATIGQNFISCTFANNNVLIEVSQASSIFIYISGKKDNRKELLLDIRTKIDGLINQLHNTRKIENIEIKRTDFVTRSFDYSTYSPEKTIIRVDYDKLLKHKQARINKYFDQKTGIKVDVSDLIEYIGAENDTIDRKWAGTATVSSVHIKNFKIIRNLEIKLSSAVNIILGNNGLGKSTILQAITLGLLPIENNDYPIEIHEYIRLGEAKAEIRANWGDNECRKLSVYKQGRPDEESPLDPPPFLLLSYGANLNTNRQQDHSKMVSALISGANDLYFTKSIFSDSYINFHNPLIILKELDERIKTGLATNRYELKQQVLTKSDLALDLESLECILLNDLLLSCLNEYLSLVEQSERIQIVYHAPTLRYYFKDLQGNLLEIQHLSDGYKDHILLLTDIITRILSSRKLLFEGTSELTINKGLLQKARAVILIDEFDRHLHPVWQRRLLSKLKIDFPNIQFILTTHNPFSVQAATGANAVRLEALGSEIIAQNSTIRNKNILNIIREYFTDDFFDFESQDLLKQFSAYMDRIDEGNTGLVYEPQFKENVRMIFERGDELQAAISTQLLQLNSSLKKMNLKEFEL